MTVNVDKVEFYDEPKTVPKRCVNPIDVKRAMTDSVNDLFNDKQT